jgi:hypothetical protein
MSKSTALSPTVTIGTAYFVSNSTQITRGYSLAQQPLCQQTGMNQTVVPNPSPSR